ncbi:DNA polymerase III subunit gamma/tau [Candidatus Dependentiae bacterium]
MNSTLNLARKWRPKTFNQIAGQQIPISILLNSLFSQKLFPVYLFAGQRGCGKTSSARIFGSAINCKNLTQFQENSKENKVPCLKCDSCKAMINGNHPDFIEIDAASHTGVENVRQILEVCSYLPILGSKKIYLIDEAHMLSKAAFNAFLKVLEEPPASALFILATTEIQKFPETVLSRCFQIIFKAVENIDLEEHLGKICKIENIEIEEQAIKIIIQETEGSVRDAINLLERVRFSESKVTVNSLLKVLGKISEAELFEIFENLLEKNPTNLLNKLNSPTLENIDSQILWNSLVQLCRSLIWIKFKSEKLPTYFNNTKRLHEIAQKCSINRLNAIFQLLWTQEELFLRTPQKRILFETILLQICQQTNIIDLENILNKYQPLNSNSNTTRLSIESENNLVAQKKPPAEKITSNLIKTKCSPNLQIDKGIENNLHENTPLKAQRLGNPPNLSKTGIKASNQNPWNTFLKKISTVQDPMLISIFNQSQFIEIDNKHHTVNISLKNNSSFLRDKINDSKNIWINSLREVFTDCQKFNFIKQSDLHSDKKMTSDFIKMNNNSNSSPTTPIKTQNTSYNTINLSDKDEWPKANLLLKHFPGKIKVYKTKK